MTMPDPISCPALLVAAPASGQGKTTVTAALAHWHRSQSRRVRVFKTGPDFLDPMVLARASGAPVRQLDLWMGGPAHCAELLHQAAAEADLILVEGVMGLHDGNPSSADLALHFGLPVLAVIDASAMAQTFGALALGLATYRPGLQLVGVLANRVASASHAQMLRESLPPGLGWYGALPRDEALSLPSRHLGLVRADEVADIEQRISRAAQALGHGPLAAGTTDTTDTTDSIDRAAAAWAPPLPPPVCFAAPALGAPAPGQPLAGTVIAVAQDAAFCFLYPANLDLLRALGATLRYFSPLADPALPADAQALYLPGGYPELHLATLAGNTDLQRAVRAHHAAGRPIVAECGGLLALLQTLTDGQGQTAAMLGLLPGHAVMAPRLVNLGLHSVQLPEGLVRGHTFHHARVDSPLPPATHTQAQRHHGQPEAVYRDGRLWASFLHLYFPSNPAAVAALFRP
jgi:cobyrinic acid a,c-diamide synthase